MLSEYSKRVLITVRAADRDYANQVASRFDPGGAGETFSIPLSAAGVAPPTDWGCCSAVTPDLFAQIPLLADQFPGAQWVECSLDGPLTPTIALADFNLRPILSLLPD